MSNSSYVRTRRHLLDERNAAALAEFFRAMADTSRLRIISLLINGERPVREIAETLGMSESAVSHQLRGLRQMRLVRTRKNGREVIYALDDQHVTDMYLRGLEHMSHK